MNEIIDKILLFGSCITLYLFQEKGSFFIVPVIITIILSSLFTYYENYRIRITGIILYILLCLIIPNYIIFLPVILYDIMITRYQLFILIVPFLYVFHFTQYNTLLISFTSIILAASGLLKYKTDRLNSLRKEYNELRDSSTQISLRLKEKTQSLLQNQVNEINLATLNERNRISKELHDSIGHLLSRSLLQVGALLTISKEATVTEGLSSLKESLSNGMDQIRISIHNMYDDSIDLYQQFYNLVKDFSFCPIEYSYDITNQPSLQLKHNFISITKEALANIMHHSNATKTTIILREHPAMYQLIIQDNGTIGENNYSKLSKQIEDYNYGEGMGLRNIADRVSSFGGILNITIENGFRIFITVPKAASINKSSK